MTKREFEILLRNADEVARERDFFLIGSQALRGVCAAIPRDIPKTIEADLYPQHNPQAWPMLRAELGNASKCFKRHGYYLDCTDPALAVLPGGWLGRLKPFRTPRTGGVTAWCLEQHDLFVNKLVVYRAKHKLFLRAVLRHKLVKVSIVRRRINCLPISSSRKMKLAEIVLLLMAETRVKRRNVRKKY